MSVNSALYEVQDRLFDLVPAGWGITKEQGHTSLRSDGGLGIHPTSLGMGMGGVRWQCAASILTDADESFRMGGRKGIRWAVTGLALPLPMSGAETPFFTQDGTGTINTKPWKDAEPPSRLAEAWVACIEVGLRGLGRRSRGQR